MTDPHLAEIQDLTHKPQSATAKSILREVLETLFITAVIFFAVNSVTGRFRIYGASMDDTFSNGQYIIVNRLAYKLGEPERGDVIVFVPPGHLESTFWERLIGVPGETDFIKRVIGVPGDKVRIEGSRVYVNGQSLDEPYIRQAMAALPDAQEWNLGPGQYFALGDNRNFSKDSRDSSVGSVDGSRIVGQVLVVYWPVADWKLVEHYRYP